MRGARAITAAVGATTMTAAIAVAGTSGTAGAAPRPAITALRGSVAPFTATTSAIGGAPGSRKLTIQVWLRPRTAAAERYAVAVSSPGSALFHRYLSPDRYTARFGPSQSAARRVAAWLRAEGFAGIHAVGHRSYVRATASIATIEAALRTRIKLYRSSAKVHAGRDTLRANSRPVSVPAALAGSVLGVTGLDNAAVLDPTVHQARPGTAQQTPCSQYYGQHIAVGQPRQFGTTRFPTQVCGYSARQLRAGYEMNSVSTGKGEKIALVVLGLTRDMLLTLRDYAAANGLPAPSASRYAELSLQPSACKADAFNIEEQLDVEAAYAMAPAAGELVVAGNSCDDQTQSLIDADIAVLGNGNHPLATIASNSWEAFSELQPASLINIIHAYLVRAAAEGVGMYFGAGDGSGVNPPSSDPFATAVGGTTLGIGKTSNRLFETGWSDGESIVRGGKWSFQDLRNVTGGGPSMLWKEPAYQKGVVPAALATAPGNRGAVRSVPDLSADADPFTPFAYGFLTFPKNKPPRYNTSHLGGTSLSAPLVAGIVAAAQQGQGKPFGLINPALYKLAGTSAVTDTRPLSGSSPVLWRGVVCPGLPVCGQPTLITFDDQVQKLERQVTLKGYDNMTGIGTPNGQKFITALRKLAR
jgi:subtilase family serine protease